MIRIILLIIILLYITPCYAEMGYKSGSGYNTGQVTQEESGHVIPYKDDEVDLGSEDKRFQDIYTETLNAEEGIMTKAKQGSSSIELYSSEGETIEHSFSNNSGSFDLTGGTFENIFTDTTNDPFTQTDEDNNNWIRITSEDSVNLLAQIEDFIDSENVVLFTLDWEEDLNNVNYNIIKHPSFVQGDGGVNEFFLNSEGYFSITGIDWAGTANGRDFVDINLESEVNDVRCVRINHEANANFLNVPLSTLLDVGNIPSGRRATSIISIISLSNAVDTDSTSRCSSYVASTIGTSNATRIGYTVSTGFDEALSVASSSSKNMDYGYEVSSGVVTDRVNGGTDDATAFLDSSSSDLPIFDSDNDYILIGDDATFEIITVDLLQASGKNIGSEFYYSTGNGTWSTLTVSLDQTSGFQASGNITFDAPGDWAVSNEAEASGDITSAYYIKILRTLDKTPSVQSTEEFFKIYESSDSGFVIYADGSILIGELADTDANNGTIYYSTDQGKLVFKNSSGVVKNLY